MESDMGSHLEVSLVTQCLTEDGPAQCHPKTHAPLGLRLRAQFQSFWMDGGLHADDTRANNDTDIDMTNMVLR